MKKLLLLAFACIAILSACKKQNTKADFSVSKSSFYLTENVNFNNQSSNGKSYSWDFGDGQTSDQESPSHKYTKAGNYQVKLTTGNSSLTKNIKIFNGTASYQVSNQVSGALPLVSFWVDANDDIQDFKDHGTVASNGKTDTVATSNSTIYVGGFLGTKVFIVQKPYTITKYAHNDLPIINSTTIVVEQSIKTAITSLHNNSSKGTTFMALPGTLPKTQ